MRHSTFALIAVLSTAVSSAADWPQWRGLERTGHVPAGEKIPAKLPAEPRVVWQVPIGDGFASPVIAGGRVFCPEHKDEQEIARAFDAATGKELWAAPLGSAHRDGFGIGPRTTPTADGQRVFFQTAKGEFQCLDAASGKQVWRTNFVDDLGAVYTGEKGQAAGASRHGATGSPVVENGRVFAQVGSANGASIVAFDAAKGAVAWKSQNDQTSYAAPVLADVVGKRMLVAFTIEGLIGLDPADGKLLWRRALTTRLGRHVTTPIIAGDLVIVASHQIGLTATRIAKNGADFTATEAWTDKAMTINFSTPVLVDGHLYGLGPAKNIVCIEAATGQKKWEQIGLIQSSPDRAEAAFLALGKTVLCLTDTGTLLHFAAEPAAYRELGQSQACGKTWCNPAYSDGRLYLRDDKTLRCLELVP